MGRLWLVSSHSSLVVQWELWPILHLPISIPLVIDMCRALFLRAVSAITAAVALFSFSYMAKEPFYLRFHLLVLRFVGSIWLLIISPNLIRVILGWDGLGVTSYLLVIYFQHPKAFNAGAITALTNRIGDVLILLRMATAASQLG